MTFVKDEMLSIQQMNHTLIIFLPLQSSLKTEHALQQHNSTVTGTNFLNLTRLRS